MQTVSVKPAKAACQNREWGENQWPVSITNRPPGDSRRKADRTCLPVAWGLRRDWLGEAEKGGFIITTEGQICPGNRSWTCSALKG